MSHDELAELLAAYALDAVDPGEAVLVEAHLGTCPRCAAELDAHRDVVGRLGDLGGDAPRELWDAIASQATVPPGVDTAVLTAADLAVADRDAGARPHRRAPRRRALAACAAVLAGVVALAIVAMAVRIGTLDGRVGSLRAVAEARGLTEAAQAALLDPAARRVALDGPHGEGMLAELVVVPGAHSFLVDSTLRPLGPSETYQLWAVRATGPVSLGLLGADPRVVPFVVGPRAGGGAFAITVEPATGSTAPSGHPVAVSAQA